MATSNLSPPWTVSILYVYANIDFGTVRRLEIGPLESPNGFVLGFMLMGNRESLKTRSIDISESRNRYNGLVDLRNEIVFIGLVCMWPYHQIGTHSTT